MFFNTYEKYCILHNNCLAAMRLLLQDLQRSNASISQKLEAISKVQETLPVMKRCLIYFKNRDKNA